MKIAIGCDHGGIVLKEAILAELNKRGIEVVDKGCFDSSSVDYPDYGENSVLGSDRTLNLFVVFSSLSSTKTGHNGAKP